MPPMQRYEYQPLSGSQIRVLGLQPGRYGDDLYVTLRHIDLSLQPGAPEEDLKDLKGSRKLSEARKRPKYQALSYCWGIPDTSLVRVGRVQDSASFIKISDNLDAALRQLRARNYAKTLWIDALCINQSDINERSRQVRLMGDVYRRAERVIIWLGPEKDNSSRAMRYIGFVGTKVQYDWGTLEGKPTGRARTQAELKLAGKPPFDEMPFDMPVRALRDLFARPWFERVWIRQEAYLATRAVVYCGSAVVDWHSFRQVTLWWMFFQPSEGQTPFDVERARLLRELTSPFTIAIMRLRHTLAGTKCTNPSDKVYGTLALLDRTKTGQPWVIPDYNLPVAGVYTELAKRSIEITRTLNFMASCELETPRLEGLPSWVPDWSTAPIAMEFEYPTLPSGRLLSYARVTEASTLSVAGVVKGSVAEVSQTSWTDCIGNTSFWFVVGKLMETVSMIPMQDFRTGFYEPGAMPIHLAFIRTMVCGNFGDLHDPPEENLATFKQATSFFKFLEAVERQDMTSFETDKPDFQKYMASVIHMCIGKRFFITKEGYLGVGPQAMLAGDRVFFPLGGNYPLIIRPEGVSSESRQRYRVVGACYLDGFMYGEVFYGPLPEAWGVLAAMNTSTGESETVFTTRTGLRSYSHPGFRDLREKFGIRYEQDLTPEMLLSHGVPVEEVDLA